MKKKLLLQSGPLNGQVIVPGSKSITNRAFLLAAIGESVCKITNPLKSVDTEVGIQVLRQLGVKTEEVGQDFIIHGNGGRWPRINETLFTNNAGTVTRFLLPMLLAGEGNYLIDGNERMRLRPLGDLLETLKSEGYEVSDTLHTGCPPVEIIAKGYHGGNFKVKGNISSQFTSALMLAAPLGSRPTRIEIDGPLVSRTYVEMTSKILNDFGVKSEFDNSVIKVSNEKKPNIDEYIIEADASSASYFFAAAAITGGSVKVLNTSIDSTQGDIGLVNILESMGCEVLYEKDGIRVSGRASKAVEVNMNSMSDVAPTLAVVAAFAEGKTIIRDVENMRVKECDRIHALYTELSKIGCEVEEFKDGLAINGSGKYNGAEFETYDDHRMAMCLSLIGLKVPDCVVLDPDCVTKTFPNYFHVLDNLIFKNSTD